MIEYRFKAAGSKNWEEWWPADDSSTLDAQCSRILTSYPGRQSLTLKFDDGDKFQYRNVK